MRREILYGIFLAVSCELNITLHKENCKKFNLHVMWNVWIRLYGCAWHPIFSNSFVVETIQTE